MFRLEIQAQVGSASSKHLEDISKTQAALSPTSRADTYFRNRLQTSNKTDFMLSRHIPYPTEHDPMSLAAQSASSVNIHTTGLTLSSCHHAQHVKACGRDNSLSTRDTIAITTILRQNGATTNLLGIATLSCDSVSITRCNYILLSVKPLTSTNRV